MNSPAHRFRLSVPRFELDFDLCLFSGQVFRWRRTPDGYEGKDGRNHYRIVGDTVEANAGPDAFHRLFRLDWGETAAQAIIAIAPEIADTVGNLRGLRLMRPSDPAEVFYTFLCTANNHLKRIVPMVEKLAALSDFRSESIAAIPESELRALGFGYRAATIPHAAKEAMSRGGDSWIEGLGGLSYEEAHRELTAIKGIGHKLADCICLYGLDQTEAVPIDTHLWQAVRGFFPEHAGKPLTDKRYRQVGDSFRDRFGKLAGWAHLYLYFDHMQNQGQKTQSR